MHEGLPSFAALDLVLSRCTEAGAYGFHIVQAERSVARGSKPDRWQEICREATMLSRRLRVPEVSGPSPLGEVVAASEHPVMLVRTAPLRLADMRQTRDLTLLVGPEGGWSERELELVALKASLGPRNLRADTAALVALATGGQARAAQCGNSAAGFEEYGLERRALKVGSEYYDELLMALPLLR